MDKNEKPQFAVMAKPVGSRCNMHCTYCYYLEKGKYSTHAKQSRMSASILEKYISEYISASPGPNVSFTWHGGEPTLAGLEFYKKVVKLQKKYLPEGWEAWNNLQTNGLLLNNEWCAFLKENRFDVGLSIDGDKAVHDSIRRDLGGNPTFDRVHASAKRLQSYGIQPDLLCTVNSESVKDPLAVYNGLKEIGTGWIQFIPIVVRFSDGTFSPESVTPEGYGKFLIAVFDEWIKNDLGRLDVQFFAECARVWAGGRPSLCWMTEECGKVLIVEEDGSIYSCDHFVDNEHRIGNLADTTLEAALNSRFQTQFGKDKRDKLTKECRTCPYLNCCGGGCLKDRFAESKDGEEGQYYLCAGLKAFFDHAKPIMLHIMDLSRKGKKAYEIMKQLKEEGM